MSDALKFLATLFEKKPPQSYILIWSTPSKESRWFVDPAQAAVYAESLAQRENIYFGVAFTPDPRSLLDKYEKTDIKEIRCRADDTLGITGVWADIDVLGPGHKKQNLPRSDSEAYEILNAIPQAPSIVTHSGGGLQAYWQFDEPLLFETPTDRQRGAELAERWQILVKQIASDIGLRNTGYAWDVDSTFDLARVFRVAGTFNIKTPPARKVVINQLSGWRYTVQELEQYLDSKEIRVSTKAPKKEALQTSVGDFKLSKNAKPDFETFDALYSDDPKFRKTWDRKRKDLTDQSPSGYDLSIASMLYNLDWSDQEIINALLANHAKHGDDLKLDRPDYYARTLARAKVGISQQQQIEAEQVADFRADEKNFAPTDRAKVLKEVSDNLGVNVTGWVKFMSDPVNYFLEIDGQYRVSVGDGGAVMNSRQFAKAVYNACDIALPGFKQPMWNKIINKLALAKTIQHPDITETPAGYCRYYLIKYLSEKVLAENIEEAIPENLPFWGNDGHRYFFLEPFKAFMKLYGANLNKGYSDALRMAGADIYTKQYKKASGEPGSKSVWRFPEDI